MKILLLGAGGMLARAMLNSAPANVSLSPLTRGDLDVTDRPALMKGLSERPECVINCSAWTRVDDAEEHEREATMINGDAVGWLGEAAAALDARVLHISTEYVFDGRGDRPYREEDAPNPQGAYGRSKLAGERALAESGCRWTVVRTQWLYGGGSSFVRLMWNRAKQGCASRVVNDQWGAPTHVAELAAVLWSKVSDGSEGMWHAAAGGATSWFEVARKVYAAAGADPRLVTPCSTAEYGARAPRPQNGRLDTTKIGGLRSWDEVLTEYLRSVKPAELP